VGVWAAAALIAAASMMGMAIQRSVGLGFALTAAPIFSLVVGPFDGVLLANALALVVTSTVLVSTWRGVDLRKFAVLAGAGVIAVVPGALLASRLPTPLLQIFAGTTVTVILLLQLRHRHRGAPVVTEAPWTMPAAGAACGFLNATAGAGGPPVAIYAAATRWENRSYVPTLQLTFLCVNLGSLLAKGLPTPSIRPWPWPLPGSRPAPGVGADSCATPRNKHCAAALSPSHCWVRRPWWSGAPPPCCRSADTPCAVPRRDRRRPEALNGDGRVAGGPLNAPCF